MSSKNFIILCMYKMVDVSAVTWINAEVSVKKIHDNVNKTLKITLLLWHCKNIVRQKYVWPDWQKKTKEKYGVKNINELTKPQIRKYKIDRARLFKGIEQYMYVHEDITISSNVNEVIRAVLNSLYFFFAKRFSRHQKYQKHQKHQKHKSKKTQSSKSTNAISEQKLKMRLKKV